MAHPNEVKNRVRRLAEAALVLAKYTREGTEVAGVLLSGLAGDAQELLDVDAGTAERVAERLEARAREQYVAYLRTGL